jgi:chemotaxis protein methyltransferase CheR
MATAVLEHEELTESQFQDIASLVRDVCGISLHDGKKELVKARLGGRLRHLGLRSFGQYLDYVHAESGSGELRAMLDALSTNQTSFFREQDHFDFLAENVLPEFVTGGRRSQPLRIWSAGCSTGEEPYSIGMTICEVMPEAALRDVRVLATDISCKVLARARQGLYPAERLASVPNWAKTKYFAPHDAAGGLHAVKAAVRNLVSFGRLNLMESWPMRGPFDVIFCRNVMIYFDKPTQGRIVGRYWDLLRPGGVLFIGHSESLTGIRHKFQYVQPTVYRRPQGMAP